MGVAVLIEWAALLGPAPNNAGVPKPRTDIAKVEAHSAALACRLIA